MDCGRPDRKARSCKQVAEQRALPGEQIGRQQCPGCAIIRGVDTSEIQAAFDDVFDQAILFHGFADYMRDYEIFIYATADPPTGIRPAHLRYRFRYCVQATITSAI
jgi:hypothetical protein